MPTVQHSADKTQQNVGWAPSSQHLLNALLETLAFHGICHAINLCCVILILFLILAFILRPTVYARAMLLLFMGKLLVHACALLSCYHVLVSIVITVCMFSE